jgi:hypothetical protein
VAAAAARVSALYDGAALFLRLARQSGVGADQFRAIAASPRSAGREPSPSAGVIDSQSVKTTEAGGPRGFDAAKKVNGRKRHVITDTIGLLVGAEVPPIGKIATVLGLSSPPFTTSFRGCVTSSPTAPTPATSC